MKLASFRKYKNDISDIVGILISENNKGNEILIENIKEAVTNLYGTYDYIEKEAQAFIEDVLKDKKFIQIYNDIAKDEKLNNKIVHESKNIISNTKSINVVLLETKNKRLCDLYKQLGIVLTEDMSNNARLAQDHICEMCKQSKNKDQLKYSKEFFGDLFYLHNQYIKK